MRHNGNRLCTENDVPCVTSTTCMLAFGLLLGFSHPLAPSLRPSGKLAAVTSGSQSSVGSVLIQTENAIRLGFDLNGRFDLHGSLLGPCIETRQ